VEVQFLHYPTLERTEDTTGFSSVESQLLHCSSIPECFGQLKAVKKLKLHKCLWIFLGCAVVKKLRLHHAKACVSDYFHSLGSGFRILKHVGPASIKILRRQVFISRPINDHAQGIETRTMTRTVPCFFARVPRYDASEMHANRRHTVNRSVVVSINCYLRQSAS
jgi:hypothetical protein